MEMKDLIILEDKIAVLEGSMKNINEIKIIFCMEHLQSLRIIRQLLKFMAMNNFIQLIEIKLDLSEMFI